MADDNFLKDLPEMKAELVEHWNCFADLVADVNAGNPNAMSDMVDKWKAYKTGQAVRNARLQGIAACIVCIAVGDPISPKIRGKLSPSQCDEAAVLMRRLGVSVADFQAAGVSEGDRKLSGSFRR